MTWPMLETPNCSQNMALFSPATVARETPKPLAKRFKREFPQQVRSIYIHDVVNTSQEQREDWRSKGVIFFDTYVGAAVEAWKSSLISKEGVQRVRRCGAEERSKPWPLPTPNRKGIGKLISKGT